jgi:transcription elongation factor GreA
MSSRGEIPVTDTTTQTWLTQEAHDRLVNELEHLTGPGRAEIVQRIESAREEGDLRENGGYHAAKEEQGKQEARIRQLQVLLRTAKVGEAPTTDGVVALGSVVTVRFPGDDDTMTFLLGSREAGDVDLEVYSPQSPLGAAVAGKSVGEQATYAMPSGRQATVEIVSATPYTG